MGKSRAGAKFEINLGKKTLIWLLLAASVLLAFTDLALLPGFVLAEPGAADPALFRLLQSNVRPEPPRSFETPPQKTVFLTFDDGPSTNTPNVLRILREEQIPATFFVLGQYVKSYPGLIQQMIAEGHAVGNHTYDHVYNKLYGGFGEFWRQTMLTESILGEQVGVRTRLLRAPGGTAGNFDAFYYYMLEQAGYTIFDWNVDSGDSKRAGVPAAEILRNATNTSYAAKTPNEIVVLMHDGIGHSETVKALPDVIKYYRSQGYTFAALTPNVQPVQQTLGKLKWTRSHDLAEYTQYAGLAEAHATSWWKDQQPPAAAADDPPLPAAPVQEEPLPMSLHIGQSTLRMESSEYAFRGGRHFVPLRVLVEALGGHVGWTEATNEVTVRYGLRTIVYDVNHHAYSLSTPWGPEKTYTMAEFGLISGEIAVPLRDTVEMLGGTIDAYATDGGSREIWIGAGQSWKY